MVTIGGDIFVICFNDDLRIDRKEGFFSSINLGQTNLMRCIEQSLQNENSFREKNQYLFIFANSTVS